MFKDMMTKYLRNALLGVLAAGMTASCSSGEDPIWDIAPVVISVKVLSPEGYSVLNENTASKISATYQGKTYVCHSRTRTYMPDFYGLAYTNDYLLFGELSGEETYHAEEIVIDWGDGSKRDTITFSHRLEWKHDKPTFKQEFRLNGKVTTDQMVIYKDLTANNLNEEDHTPRRWMPLSDSQKELASRINDFGFNLFRQMYAASNDPYGSCVASPLSVSYVLGMLATGARFDFGENDGTRAEILEAMGMKDSWQYDFIDPMNEFFKLLVEYTPLVDTSIDIQLANALFVRNSFTIYGGYPAFLAEYYKADYERLDFTSPTALERINGWCNQKTKGLIPSILDEIPEMAVAYFLNAIYFKGGWALPFEAEQTKQENFTHTDGSKQTLPLMHGIKATSYAQAEWFDAVQLPFAKGAYTMTILLPHQGASIDDMVNMLNKRLLDDLPWQKAQVTLTLPRFSVESDYKELHHQVEALGIHRMFTPKAEFSEISPDPELYISMMRQKARLKVDEEGCEAAAVTITEMVTTSVDPEPELPLVTFCADRPFAYLITEQSSGAVFFVGTYGGE